MQAYQRQLPAYAECCPLIAACFDRSKDHAGSKRPVVPGSPGHARRSLPYPRHRGRQ